MMTDETPVPDRHHQASHVPCPAGHGGWLPWIVGRWPTAIGLVFGVVMLLTEPEVGLGFSIALVVMAVLYPIFGAARRDLRPWSVLLVEMGGVLGFGVLAVVALLVNQDVARYLVAAALFGHAAWDVVHHLANRVVPRWYAEACMVFDALLGAGILLFR